MMSWESDLMAAVGKVRARGLSPSKLELGPDLTDFHGAAYFLGLGVVWRPEPGAAILALPDRRIGRYEVVIPERFEVTRAAPPEPVDNRVFSAGDWKNV